MNEEGNLLKYEEFSNKYKIICTMEDYRNVVDYIPIAMINIIRNNLDQSQNPRLHQTKINGINFRDKKCNNRLLRKLLSDELFPGSSKRRYYFKNLNKQEIQSIRTNFFTFPIPPKWKEIHFKMVNEIYPSQELINKIFKFEMEKCCFCKSLSESTEHLFFKCEIVHKL